MENNIDKTTAMGIATLFAGSDKLRVLFAGTHDAIGTLAMIRSFEEICATEPYCVIGNENKRTYKILSENSVCIYGKIRHLHIIGKFDLVVPSGINEKESVMNAIRLAPVLVDGTLVLLFAKIKRVLDGMQYDAQNQIAKMIGYGYNLIGAYQYANNAPIGILLFRKSSQAGGDNRLTGSFSDPGIKINREVVGKMRIVATDGKKPLLRLSQFGNAAMSQIMEAMTSELAWRLERKNTAKKPLIPLSSWHSFLAVSSGLYEGPLVDKNKRMVLVKGRVVVRKTSSQRVVQLEKTNGAFDELIEIERKYVPVVEMTAVDITKSSDTFGEVFNVR